LKIPLSYYQHSDVISIAKELIGKYLFTNIGGTVTAGMITETEAYAGIVDRASHAFGERRTERTKVMYAEGGISYVYLCYGVHYLFNVVTGMKEEPHAVLIRAIYPTIGNEKILERTRKNVISYKLTDGPGKLSKALGISSMQNGLKLDSNVVWIEDLKTNIDEKDILITERIGVQYAGEDAKLPYRFLLKPEILAKKRALE
jgi:DNA-3-methyladenine glycosylase